MAVRNTTRPIWATSSFDETMTIGMSQVLRVSEWKGAIDKRSAVNIGTRCSLSPSIQQHMRKTSAARSSRLGGKIGQSALHVWPLVGMATRSAANVFSGLVGNFSAESHSL